MTEEHDHRLKDYRMRMRLSPQFRRFGLDPVWRPGEGDIEGFIHDEVVRQWHDPRVEHDGGIRVKWMTQAWEYAQARYITTPNPFAHDIRTLGQTVEPKVNPDGFRPYAVFIGNREGAPWGAVPMMVDALVEQLPVAPEQYNVGWSLDVVNRAIPDTFLLDYVRRIRTADDWYLAYEWVHPFGDGNGRSGKILHNWILGTLDEPVLVDDYFGGGNP